MGWNNGNDIFNPVARKALELGLTDEQVTGLLTVLIAEMQKCDWDTEGESLDEFESHPAVVEAFRRNNIIIKCGEQGDDWCSMERGHTGNVHEDELGKKWTMPAAT